jgi:8-oxo-dGTP diphosphatase
VIETVAWVRVENGRILCARSRGKDVFYIPGGKREAGETELDALLREIREELTVDLVPETVRDFGVYRAQAHAHADGVLVVMSCYTAEYQGTPSASGEIEELDWLGYADRDQVAPVDQLLFDDLRAAGQLAVALTLPA